MATSREVVRDALATLLSTALVGVGLPAKTVVKSKVETLEGLTPLVAVLSSGTLREKLTFMGDIPTFSLEIQVWVLQEGTGWTTAQAEDALDRIESLIAGVYQDNRGTDQWTVLEYDGKTTVVEATSNGRMYYLESIPTLAKTSKS